MRFVNAPTLPPAVWLAVFALACARSVDTASVPIHWYVFQEPSGAFTEAARRCSEQSRGAFRVEIAELPADADQQREQLVRRLAARDFDIDIIGMDVMWTAEFARAGWLLPWSEDASGAAGGRLRGTVESATYENRLWAMPFTTNAQLLWYRSDRVERAPATWDEMIRVAQELGPVGIIQAQGQRYEGLTVFFLSLLASAGGRVLEEGAGHVSLEEEPTRRALEVMKRLATSSAADPSLSTTREDEARLAFESGKSTFMVNYPFVWPSAARNAPEVARWMRWARWPAVVAGQPSRVTIGGLNLGVGSSSRHPRLAFRAATCLASEESQLLSAMQGGLLPTSEHLYELAEVRAAFPFVDVFRATLEQAVQRPQTPVYADISLAISRTLHPMRRIDPARDVARLREVVTDALESRGLL